MLTILYCYYEISRLKYHLWPAQSNHLSPVNEYIMDVSKGLYVSIKRMSVFHMLMDKPTGTLIPVRCKGVTERLGSEF